jgi:hypothetical protein
MVFFLKNLAFIFFFYQQMMMNIPYFRAFKTRMCRYEDACRKKAQCSFAHAKDELKTFYPVIFDKKMRLWKTRMCRFVENDILCFDEDCYDAHDEMERRPLICRYQSLCLSLDCSQCHFTDSPQYYLPAPPQNNTLQIYKTMETKWNTWYTNTIHKMEEIQKELTSLSYQLHSLEMQYEKEIEKLSNETSMLLNECLKEMEETEKEEWECFVSFLDSHDLDIKHKKQKTMSSAPFFSSIPQKQWGDDDDDDDW